MADNAFINRGTKIVRVQLTSSTNPTIIFSGKAVVQHILLFSSLASPTFVKLYDKSSLPTSSDTPIITTRFNTTTSAAYPQISAGLKRTLDYFCENGIALRTTANVDDSDDTAITISSGVRWVYVEYLEV